MAQNSYPARSTVGSTVIANAFEATGLTGATTASRYAGATTSGAPVSGAFVVGDFIIARNGGIWICTEAGSPGSWAEIRAIDISGAGLDEDVMWMQVAP
jgi:hypothetical protein